MNNKPPTQRSSAPTQRPTAAATSTQHDEGNEQVLRRDCDRADQMFLDDFNKEKKEKEGNEQTLQHDRNRAYLNRIQLKDCVKKTERALFNEKDELSAAIKTEMKGNANMKIEHTKNYKRLDELMTAAEEASEQWEREKDSTEITSTQEELDIMKEFDATEIIRNGMLNENYWYRLKLITEANATARNQTDAATRRPATVVTFAPTPPEEQAYQKNGLTTTVTRGITGGTVDGKKIHPLNKNPRESDDAGARAGGACRSEGGTDNGGTCRRSGARTGQAGCSAGRTKFGS